MVTLSLLLGAIYIEVACLLLQRLRANFDDLSDEDKILVFFKRLLLEWEEELANRPEAERRTGRGKSSVATFKQCARYLKPLFKMCRKKVIITSILNSPFIVYLGQVDNIFALLPV